MNAPSGNVTFLFTDIERSSQLWEMHPQAMGRALSRHDELMRTVIADYEGHIFKTIGDAFCVAFGGALDATRSAVELQRQLSAAVWEETGPLRVRMALHSGEAEQRDGDYFGQTLNRVARILAAGHGGQTLLSRVTAERVREKLPPEISLRDLGERRLKDLSRPERIYQLITNDLPADFPPLRSLEVLPNNLPAQLTTFIGRDREMAEVKRLVGQTRLLTLTGAGGTGKTRLSLQLAAELLDCFPHGVWLVELATVSDGALVADVIANTLDVREEPGRAAVETLVRALQGRTLLLVLDNCEHLIDCCAELSGTLLQRCPQLTIVATSREPLRIPGETAWPVPALAAPDIRDDDGASGFDRLARIESAQLFADRAAAVRPDFALTAENAALVAEICWRLDGIPLAIELAAARVKMLTLAQILTRLDNRFHLLSGGSRTALPRQQTLGALIDWSYDLLSEPEKKLFRRLAVFVAGRSLELTEEVCSGEGLKREDIFDVLSGLVDKSLVTTETGPDGESRYTMLESLWDYAEEKLAQHQETARYRDRHLDCFMRLAEEIEPQLIGPDQKRWLEKLSAEHHNLTFALRWSIENKDALERGLRLAGAVSRYWEVRSYLTEGREHFEALLSRAGDSIPPAILAKAHLCAGRLAWCQDRDDEALRHLGLAQSAYEQLGRPVEAGLAHALSGFAERNLGNAAAARARFEQAQQIGQEQQSERLIATAMSGFGSLAADEGDLRKARALKEESLARVRAIGDKWIMGVIAWSLGKVYVSLGEHEVARAHLRESLLTSRELGNKWSVPYAIEAIADICVHEGHVSKAIQLYGSAAAQRAALGLSFSQAERTAHDEAITRLRALVAPNIFDSEWAAGEALGWHASTSLAIEPAELPRRSIERARSSQALA